MKAKLDIPVILAKDYDSLVQWYKDTLPFEISKVVSEGYHYTTFKNSGQEILGIADAEEMGVTPPENIENTVIVQIIVSDISGLFSMVQKNGGKILFGPKKDEESDYCYGGFLDIEGNQLWVTESQDI